MKGCNGFSYRKPKGFERMSVEPQGGWPNVYRNAFAVSASLDLRNSMFGECDVVTGIARHRTL